MNKAITIFIVAFAFIGGFLIFYDPKPVSGPVQENSSVSDTQQKLESKIDDQASVTVTVTPTLLSAKSGEWKFDIVMDTHSVELDQDMTAIAVIVDDLGNEYRPIRWEGAGAGGHHREGVLTFGQTAQIQKSIGLKIFTIGDVVRSFAWELK